MQSSAPRNPIDIKISTIVAMAAIVHDADLNALDAALKKITAKSSDYYSQECAVIDVANIDSANMDWAALINVFKSHGFRPVAVRNAPASCEERILELGLVLDLGASANTVTDQARATPVVPSTANAFPPPLIIDTPVRGGQRIYARGTDLIITAVVNNGAEVIADGNIHIYAPLRGRALAGASGDTTARIFAFALEAELVSIAGIYRTFESGYSSLLPQTPIQIRLNGDKIDILAIQPVALSV